MSRTMLINTADPEECRVAVVEDGRLEEAFIEAASNDHHVGNIYKGRVENVEPSFQAAFVDCGFGRNGFLHVSDVNPDYLKGRRSGRPAGGRRYPKLEKCLRRGQEVIVQVTKSGIGTKGPALTTYLSLPGRFLVLMPSIRRHGVSRKIEEEVQRQRLKDLLRSLNPPDSMGVIVRTAGEGRTKRELQRDLKYLLRLYSALQKRIKKSKAPAVIYQESDLVIRVVRDYFAPDIQKIVVDSENVGRKVRDFVKAVMPRYSSRVTLHEAPEPLFHAFGVEEQIESIYDRRVNLEGGGYLIIDQTEALVAIDVNSGSFTRHRNPEQSAYELNLLAAREIARQLRLRDLSGVIIIDFVDMADAGRRRNVEKALNDALGKDKARCRVLRMSDFGIVELTRQRTRPSVRRSLFRECPLCEGKGHVRTAESAGTDVLRQLSLALRGAGKRAEVSVPPPVASYLNNQKRKTLLEMTEKYGKEILITPRPTEEGKGARFTVYDASGNPSEWKPK